MIQIGTTPFKKRIKVFSNNIGFISKFELINTQTFFLKVFTEKSFFTGGWKSSFVRRYSCFPVYYSTTDFSFDDTEIIDKNIKKTKFKLDKKGQWVPDIYGDNAIYIIDSRVVRAYILAFYEYFKYGDNFDAKKTNALLNSNVDWSIAETKEWMTRNGFKTSDSLTEFSYTPEEEDYIFDPSKLIDPYWQPPRRN